jgi:hypothetical protein
MMNLRWLTRLAMTLMIVIRWAHTDIWRVVREFFSFFL